MKKKNKPLLVLAGLSAAGKTVIATALAERDGRFSFVRSATTRPPRPDHADEYIHFTEDEFLRAKANSEFVECMEYAGYMYGTPRSELERVWQEGKYPLLILDLTGVRSVSEIKDINACAVYIYTDLYTAEERLYERFLSSERTPRDLSAFVRRKERNIQDFCSLLDCHAMFYGFIHNDTTVDTAAQKVSEMFDNYLSHKDSDETSRQKVLGHIEENLKKS